VISGPANRFRGDLGTAIWRYMDLWKLESMLEHRELHFARAVDQSDELEGEVSDLTLQGRPARAEVEATIIAEALGQQITAEQIQGIYEFNHNVLLNEMMLISWYFGNNESAEMWCEYCDPDDGVAIRSTAGRLIDCLPDVVRGSAIMVEAVTYMDPKVTSIPEGNAFDPFQFKREQFRHESELRALLIDRDANPMGFKVPINPALLIEGIYVAPNRTQEHLRRVSAVLNRWNPTLALRRSAFECPR
jgi:hypothetical protein